ncbi:acyl-CoA reductase-like NAD-dependent aldehyde dehydrogenase [Litoreibacter ponti]|uniref:Acyl-CoA reductase-like NAD-dependent aldehyde dehydrogenase n=1 Tax=Litoreibacter ponti TaxID=1510457 RepID=A0A2T6BCS8_9RHOB|nr:aldehyde dehydrogenase family protein [Litoreibacter ponti]PTX53863.1 acyl-CoA reductase-like NAD-dependent aldehyde dehydrogenase [Litoreibacter ponti]
MAGIGDIPTGLFRGNAFYETQASFAVLNKYDQTEIANVSESGAEDVDTALAQAVGYSRAPLKPYARYEILTRVRDMVTERRKLFQAAMTAEAGFPIKDANGEIDRAVQTLTLSAEEAKRLSGEFVPFGGAPTGGGRIGFTMPLPIGIVVAITPFNAPLNTVCHKVGPAFAAGNAVVLKPSDKTPLTANLLAQCFAEAGAADGALAVLHGGIPVAQALLADSRPDFYAFTGSTGAGRAIQAAAGLRRTQMELGSIAATIVLADTDIASAAAKSAAASFRKAGQVCTSIQLLMVEEPAHAEFRDAYLAEAERLVTGDPADADTDVGPMISVEAADRVTRMLEGQRLLLGGGRDGAVMQPTIIDNPQPDAEVMTKEIFGPVSCLLPIASVEEAIARVNTTPYGLASGIFTNDLQRAMSAALALDVGGVHINETSSSRVDLMPYGGTKDSGFGHEGPKYAIREMMKEKLVTISGLPV